ncbi:hypothetical protein INT45_002981 [Circinella minor]|uniref:Uncharacterized protein n=1 Tax=Circinella minor TaxID=1195481 RepID=A0A8H7SA08_9FUNG|nr:hypothetical protein INT45_002981 [Circinella minor]
MLHKNRVSSKQQQQEKKRLQEPIFFAAQVLYNNNHLRHLKDFTQELKPLATCVILSLEFLRKIIHGQAVQFTPISLLDTHLLQTRLDDFLKQWDRFELLLYQCYSRVVFGTTIPSSTFILSSSNNKIIKTYRPLPQELFSDSLTRLLPMTLHRALTRQIIQHSMIQDLDPILFIAVPRLTVLSGMVYLNNVSGWRKPNNNNNYSIWFQSQMDRMQDLKDQMNVLEEKTIMSQQQQEQDTTFSTFVQHWTLLEYALVNGWQQEHDLHLPITFRYIYISICKIADTLLADENAKSFIVILRHLFDHFADTSLASNNNTTTTTTTTTSSIITLRNQDKQDSSSSHSMIDEQTILDLAI